jgi:hypothetical protein
VNFSCDRPDKDFDEFGSVAHVDVMKLAAQGDLVAPGLRQQMRVGITSNVAQQRLMKDATARVLVETRDVREPHRQHAGSKRKIPRMPGCEVGRVGERHQKIRAPNRRYRHWLSKGSTGEYPSLPGEF